MISCVYCGEGHERPSDVKQCWIDHHKSDGQHLPTRTAADETSVPDSAGLHRPSESTVIGAKRGPTELGRNVVINPGDEIPADWRGCPVVRIDPDVLADPVDVVRIARNASIAVAGVVFEMAADFDSRPIESETAEHYTIGHEYSFVRDELHHLAWSNSIDARASERPCWEVVNTAVGLGATVGGKGDLQIAGTDVWVDGGPIRFLGPIDGVPVVHAVQFEHGRLRLPSGNDTSAALAVDQLAAVVHAGSAARIIAPAGSGKTRVLTERARHLLTQWNLPPASVSLVAFNKRAQQEMVARTADLPGLQVRTLNSIALAIVNGTPPFARQQRTWRTITEPDVRTILQRFVSVPRRRNTDPFAPWIDALGLVRLGLVDPAEVEARYGGDVDGLTEVWPHFRQALSQAGSVDFDGQIHRALEVLLTQPEARLAAQRANRVLLVDEFQDLTPAHLLLIRLLAAPGGSVFGVGDDDQTIYGYNGADPSWLIDFEHYFPGAGDHKLEVNYRCPGGVVEIADRLLRHNRRRVPKKIRSDSNDEFGWSAESSGDPVESTVAAVRRALANGMAPADIAVLTRVNATMAPVQVALSMAQIGTTGGVGAEFAERTSIRAALAWLRLASGAPFAPDDVREALRRPSRPLHPKIGDWAAEQRDCDALLRLAERLTTERDSTRVTEFADDISRLQALRSSGADTARLIHVLIDEIGLGGAVSTLDANRRGMNRGAQGDDLLAIRQLASMHEDAVSFEPWLRGHLAVRHESGGVMLATVHRVKGQEWPKVVVHLADLDQFPHRLADDVEEERRLFHVAITRARQSLTIVSGEVPSQFVAELTIEPPEHIPEQPQPLVRRAAAPKQRSEVADHPLLERGVVIAVPGLVLVDQGQHWTVIDLEPQAAVADLNGASRRFAIGAKVETGGRQRGKLGPRPGGIDEASVRAFDQLRSFRDRARQGKPAYTVFDDKTIAAIATSLPASLEDLALVRGVGPAKLEQYGSDVLGVIAASIGG